MAGFAGFAEGGRGHEQARGRLPALVVWQERQAAVAGRWSGQIVARRLLVDLPFGRPAGCKVPGKWHCVAIAAIADIADFVVVIDATSWPITVKSVVNSLPVWILWIMVLKLIDSGLVALLARLLNRSRWGCGTSRSTRRSGVVRRGSERVVAAIAFWPC